MVGDARHPAPDQERGPTGPPRPQIFGRRDSRATQKALRFFRERRIEVSFVDLATRSVAPAELRRFTDKLGASALVDESSRAYGEAGLRYLRMDDRELVDRLLERPGLLRLPLVRMGGQVSCGLDETAWRRWLTETAA